MNEQILEYRKTSAEALGLTGVFFNASTNMFYCDKRQHNIKGEKDPNDSMYIIWQPNTDANQMLMVWDLMNNQGFRIQIEYDESNQWLITGDIHWGVFDESIFIATMKVFMEWQRKEEG